MEFLCALNVVRPSSDNLKKSLTLTHVQVVPLFSTRLHDIVRSNDTFSTARFGLFATSIYHYFISHNCYPIFHLYLIGARYMVMKGLHMWLFCNYTRTSAVAFTLQQLRSD